MAEHTLKLLVHKVKMPKGISELNREFVNRALFQGPTIMS